MIIKTKRGKLEIEVQRLNFIQRISGLMFRFGYVKPLLFDFEKNCFISLHSIFVFQKFLVIWLDESNNVLEYRIVKPFEFSILPSIRFRKVVEIVFSKSNKKLIEFVVGQRKDLNR
jgi:uncharacterized membrane protein (UPF0127 family)